MLLIFSCAKKSKEGGGAPDFTLTSVDGKEYSLSDLTGKVVFVNFWATWCPPCREEIPSMVRLYNKMQGKDFQILAISVDQDIHAVKKFIKKYNITFPVLLDKEKRVYNLYNATGVPETHLINKSGIVQSSVIGSFNWSTPDVINTVNRLLAD